jgi:hypothetical protein
MPCVQIPTCSLVREWFLRELKKRVADIDRGSNVCKSDALLKFIHFFGIEFISKLFCLSET